MPAKKQDGLPPGIRKRPTARAPGYVYEVFIYSPIYGDRSERIGTDMREAKRRLADLKRQVADGTYRLPCEARAATIEARARVWLDARGDVKTLDDDEARFKNHILPVIGHLRPEHVEPRHISGLLETLRAKSGPRGTPLAQNTIRNVFANLSAFFAHLERAGAIVFNPCKRLERHERPQKGQRHEVQRGSYTATQVAAIVGDERGDAGLHRLEQAGRRQHGHGHTRRVRPELSL
jgi:hypothetical protein